MLFSLCSRCVKRALDPSLVVFWGLTLWGCCNRLHCTSESTLYLFAYSCVCLRLFFLPISPLMWIAFLFFFLTSICHEVLICRRQAWMEGWHTSMYKGGGKKRKITATFVWVYDYLWLSVCLPFLCQSGGTCFPAEPYTSIILVSYISICSGTISLPVSGHEDSPYLMTNKCWAANTETLEIKRSFNSLCSIKWNNLFIIFFIFKVEGEYFIAWLCGWKSRPGHNTSIDLNIQMEAMLLSLCEAYSLC